MYPSSTKEGVSLNAIAQLSWGAPKHNVFYMV